MTEEDKQEQEESEKGFDAPFNSRVKDIRGLDQVPSVPGLDSDKDKKALPSVKAQGVRLPLVDDEGRIVYNEDNEASVKDLHKEHFGEEQEVEILAPIPEVYGGEELIEEENE